MNAAMSADFQRERLDGKFADALGPELRALLDDPRVCDVMVNPDGRVFVERAGEQIEDTGLTLSAARRASLVKTAMMLGSGPIIGGTPILETRVPDLGWRFEGILEPAVEAPALSIRKPAQAIYALSSYVESGRMTIAALRVLREAVVERRNILIVGGTGSGKTTLANALLREVAERSPADRVVVLEDTPELKCSSANSVSMVATHRAPLLDLLRASMRLRPDRIVVGEVRGAEVLVMLSAWNTGHPGGVCTVHADSALGGLLRLEQLCAQGGARASARLEIAQAVQRVVSIERRNGHRSVREVLAIEGLDAQGDYLWTKMA